MEVKTIMSNSDPISSVIMHIFKLICSLGPLLQYLFTLRSNIQKKTKKAKRARIANKKYYNLFMVTIVLPLRLSKCVLILLVVLALISFWGGISQLINIDNEMISKIFEFSLVIVFAYALLAVFVHFNVFAFLLVHCLKIFRYVKRSPGWINAYWFLEDSNNYPMLLNESSIERLANSILEDIRLRGADAIKFQAPFSCSNNNNSKANYLLFLCSIEDCVHSYDNRDTNILNECYKYLKNCSCLDEDVFCLRNLKELHSENKNFYEYLLGLKESFQSSSDQKGSLPDRLEYQQDINSTFNRLIKEYNGEAIRMACNILGLYTPKALSENLKRFERMKRDSIRGLYYKLSRRNNIWPKFSKYPFKYFFNNGIAILLLNSHSIKTDITLSKIWRDDHFIHLVYKAESEVVKVVFNRLKNDIGSSIVEEINQFFDANFNIKLNEASLWQITDIVDLWLFDHTRNYCLMDDKKDQCSLKQSGFCSCDDKDPIWKLNQSKDIIKAGG